MAQWRRTCYSFSTTVAGFIIINIRLRGWALNKRNPGFILLPMQTETNSETHKPQSLQLGNGTASIYL